MAGDVGRLSVETWSVGGWLGVVGRSVGCSQNSLTSRFAALLEDLPQVKRGTSHSSSGRNSVNLASPCDSLSPIEATPDDA